MLLLARELRARGVQCDFWFCKPSSRYSEFTEAGGAYLGSLQDLGRRLFAGAYDVVQMTASDPAAELVALMARPAARVVVTARGALSDVWHERNCFAFTAISHGMAALNQPFTPLQIEVVRNSIALDHWAPPETGERSATSPIVAFVGRATAIEKNFPRFTRVAERLERRGMRIWIADPHEASLADFPAHECGRISPERWGRVLHAEMPAFYRAVAASGGVVLSTSRSEGFGNAVVEAAACGAPVAAPDVMGLRESVLEGETGSLYPFDASDDEVAEHVAQLIACRPAPEDCASAVRRAFAPAQMVDAYLGIYSRSAQRRAATRGIPASTPEMAVLRAHLEQQRGHRARMAVALARELAVLGRTDLAASALAIAWRAKPTHFASSLGARRALGTATRIIIRPGPLLRGTGRPGAAPSGRDETRGGDAQA